MPVGGDGKRERCFSPGNALQGSAWPTQKVQGHDYVAKFTDRRLPPLLHAEGFPDER